MAKLPKIFRTKKFIALVAVLVIGFLLISRRGASAPVQTTRVERGEVTSELVLSGRIEAKDRATLTFQTSGKLANVSVEVGDRVKKGQFLGSLDTVKLNSDFMNALSDLRSAQATVDRVHDDLKGKGTSETFTEKETRTGAEVAKDKAYENYVKALEDLQNARFISPIEGIVARVGVSVVEATAVGGSIAFEIIDPETIFFSVNADQSEVLEMNSGDIVGVTLDSFEGELEGRVEKVGLTPDPDEAETLYEIKIGLTPSESIMQKIRVGMTGDAEFVLDQRQNVLYLDSSFVKSDSTGRYVLVGEKKEKVYIETGLEGEDRIEIIEGLEEGNEVIN